MTTEFQTPSTPEPHGHYAWVPDADDTSPVPPELEPDHMDRKLMIFAACAFLAVIGFVLIMVNNNSQKQGTYHDPAVLAVSYQIKINSDPTGSRATDVTCVETATTDNFRCLVTWSSGNRNTAEVIVAADGESWVARPLLGG